MSLSSEVMEGQIVLLIVPRITYQYAIQELTKALYAQTKKICYVSFNRPYLTLKNWIKNLGLSNGNFFFVDTVTSSVQPPPIADDCIFVQSPTALTDISLAFNSAINEQRCDSCILDAVSTLLIYQDANTVLKFVHALITKCRIQNTKIVFLALKEDAEVLAKDLVMFVDTVIEEKALVV